MVSEKAWRVSPPLYRGIPGTAAVLPEVFWPLDTSPWHLPSLPSSTPNPPRRPGPGLSRACRAQRQDIPPAYYRKEPYIPSLEMGERRC